MMLNLAKSATVLDDSNGLQGDIDELNAEARQLCPPDAPHRSTTKREMLEQRGLGLDFIQTTLLSGIGFLGWMVIGGMLDVNLPVALLGFLVVIALSVCSSFQAGQVLLVKAWTRGIRRRHYLELHQKQMARYDFAVQDYKAACANYDEKLAQLQLRAQPVIEAYNAQAQTTELVFYPGMGLVESPRSGRA